MHDEDPRGSVSGTITLDRVKVERLWLEVTGNCQLACVHCYAGSGPTKGHGRMTAAHWMGVVDDAKGLGVSMVQFIGGEPTMYPHFAAILRHAIGAGVEVEVYSNLVHVTDEVWDLLRAPGVSLAFSYYSADPEQHNAVTQRNSHPATRRNVVKALEFGIPIRAGVIDAGTGQVPGADADLRALGVTRIGVDRIRAVGRGGGNDPAELCGRCGKGVAAIGPDGEVWPCIFSRWMPVGNVMMTPLAEILSSRAMAEAVAAIPPGRAFGCDPDTECSPGAPPSSCGPRT
jgi:MoaA/NifB/PqqE/SkfB family radical SAM enzyme